MLKDKLDGIRAAAKERIPEAARQVMERATEDLRRSGALDRVVKVGQTAPDFPRLRELRARGPVVLSFFRGRW